jgi:hypothetical protein
LICYLHLNFLSCNFLPLKFFWLFKLVNEASFFLLLSIKSLFDEIESKNEPFCYKQENTVTWSMINLHLIELTMACQSTMTSFFVGASKTKFVSCASFTVLLMLRIFDHSDAFGCCSKWFVLAYYCQLKVLRRYANV